MSAVAEQSAQEKKLTSISLFTVCVVLATVTMTFGAMIAVFIVRSQYQFFWGHIHIPAILWVTTALLLVSSGTLHRARERLAHNDQQGFFRLLAWTAGLGVLFLAGQIVAWWLILHSGLVLAKNPHSWFIFLFTGLHGLHIVAGLAGLGYLLWRAREPVSGPKYLMTTRVATAGVSVFWHYLDAIWIVLFALLLTWRR